MVRVAGKHRLSNNGVQLTKAARCAPSSFRSWGQSLRAAFAAERGCSADLGTAKWLGPLTKEAALDSEHG